MGEKLFTKTRSDKFKKEDSLFDTKRKDKEAVDFRTMWKQKKAEVALWNGVVFYKNFIPLYRLTDIKDCFRHAKKGIIYAWNFNDFKEETFIKIIKDAMRFEDVKHIKFTTDPGGF